MSFACVRKIKDKFLTGALGRWNKIWEYKNFGCIQWTQGSHEKIASWIRNFPCDIIKDAFALDTSYLATCPFDPFTIARVLLNWLEPISEEF